MNEIQIFNNQEFGTIRTVTIGDKVMFCGKDVATALGYKNTSDALIKHCKKDGIAFCDITDSLGRTQRAKFISEGNVYRLVCSSELPNAEKFESWVFDEVLPTLRKTGTYTMPQTVSTASTVSPKEHLEMLKMVIEDLNMNEASKITVYNNFFNEYNLSTNLLPKYVDSKGELLSCTSCLNRIDVNIPVRTFNVMLIEQGYLEERERPSNASKTGIKKYKILTKKGLEFGENQVCPNNPRETQPLYYSGKFQELYNRVVSIRKFLGD